ncbi:MAG: hypothetical protein HOM11_15625 [Methylococcales bacterium]|jgi:twitching motility protein PilI|nr:hypothetical protein [Methylococcales bacterium]MBT7444616.1 hypothetical protein [Methylococcales bacterium]
MANNLPLRHLLDLERRCRRYASGLPQKIEVKKRWIGVGYRIADQHILSPLGEIQEILDYPSVTKLPSSKPWFHGIANVRGTLLPVIDLQSFLGLEPVQIGRRSKIMRIGMGGVQAGLLAPEIYGMKRFIQDNKSDAAQSDYSGDISRFISEKFEMDEGQWGVFSMKMLSEDANFFQILR